MQSTLDLSKRIVGEKATREPSVKCEISEISEMQAIFCVVIRFLCLCLGLACSYVSFVPVRKSRFDSVQEEYNF